MTRPVRDSGWLSVVLGVVLALGPAGISMSAPEGGEKPAAAAQPAPVETAKADPQRAAEKQAEPEKPPRPADPAEPADTEPDADGKKDEDAEEPAVAVARPVNAEPVQIFGWRENVLIQGVEQPFRAKLDTGALTSSIHVEEKELFERDGKKWVRFIVTDPRAGKPVRTRLEAPLVRIARIKEPGAESSIREVVRLAFQIGERRMRGEFTLNDRSNMLVPVLLGRSVLADLGWVDSSRTDLADEKVFR